MGTALEVSSTVSELCIARADEAIETVRTVARA